MLGGCGSLCMTICDSCLRRVMVGVTISMMALLVPALMEGPSRGVGSSWFAIAQGLTVMTGWL
jgi:hypothetical protein